MASRLLLEQMLAQREEATRPRTRLPAATLRTKRALYRWRLVGERLADLMALLAVRARVQTWLPSSLWPHWGFKSSLEGPSPSTPSTPAASVKSKTMDAQLEYAEVIKYADFVGVRQTKEKPTTLVSECLHPRTELKGAGNQYKREIFCNLCKARWEQLTPEELKRRKEMATSPGSSATPVRGRSFMSAGPMDTEVKCSCNKPAHRWQVKKKGPTEGRHFYRCQGRVCDFFLWDATEQETIRNQMDVEEETAEKFQAEIVKIQSQAEDHINQQALEMQQAMAEQKEKMEESYRNQLEVQTSRHQQEMAEIRAQMAWMQGYMVQVQANQAAQVDGGFSLVNDPSI